MALKSTLSSEEKTAEIEEALEGLDKLVDRLRVLYEQYFMGIQRQAPAHLHTDAERRIREVAQLQIRNTALRYRFATVQQKFGSYNTYWKRTLREIESGRYIRNLNKLRRQALVTGESIPEEILAAMPKRMRESIERDRAVALAEGKRRHLVDDGDTQPDVQRFEPPPAAAPGPRRGKSVTTDPFVNAGDDDIAAALAGLADEALAAIDKPARPPVAPPQRPTAGPPQRPPVRPPAPPGSVTMAPPVRPPAPPGSVTMAPPVRPPAAPARSPWRRRSARRSPGSVTMAPPVRPPAPPGSVTMAPPVRPPVAPGSATIGPPVRPPVPDGSATIGPPVRAARTTRPPASSRPPVPGMTEAETRALYAKYVKAREVVGERAEGLSYDKLVRTLQSQAPKILEQHKASRVEFNVVIRDNKVVLKAKPK
ncbi:MAG: hypothetical protein IPL61_35490 [Myxococcales bacterium]|nr:hypothetical protein [Myxococcales bacterium]